MKTGSNLRGGGICLSLVGTEPILNILQIFYKGQIFSKTLDFSQNICKNLIFEPGNSEISDMEGYGISFQKVCMNPDYAILRKYRK